MLVTLASQHCLRHLPKKWLSLGGSDLLRRNFRSQSDYLIWLEKIRSSALPAPPSVETLDMSREAPSVDTILTHADRLELSGANCVLSNKRSARDTFLQVKIPLSTDPHLRNVLSDFTNWTTIRLGKFYEVVDALTADVALRHLRDVDGKLLAAITTAGHYHSRKFHRTKLDEDVTLRSYITNVGTSSLEARTDALQKGADGNEILLNVCHTVMVAMDLETGLPLGKVGKQVPPLVIQTEDDEQRLALAKQHNEIRRFRSSQAMELLAPVSAPPTEEEMKGLHDLHRLWARQINSNPQDSTSLPPRVTDYTFRSATIMYPEQKNGNGSAFGGFVMDEAQKLAQYTATFFSKGEPTFPVGIDEAIFLQPIAIGDLVTFTARLVHSTENTCRVLVTVEVRDAAQRDRVPIRSNRLMFVFVAANFRAGIVPETYPEILMHLEAQRRYEVEGPTQEEAQKILRESMAMQERSQSTTK